MGAGMNRDDIIRMAEQAKMALGFTQGIAVMNHENLERFAAVVAAAEREECVKLFDGERWVWDYRDILAAIRKRGEK
jgi:hypothetical protein